MVMKNKMEPSAHFQIAEIELVYRSKVKASERPQITTASDAYQVLLQSWDEGSIEFIEEFMILLLNKANKVLGIYKVSKGGVSGTVADPKVIFASAIKANACALILAHNHPSGSLKPSRADEELTIKIKKGGDLLDIKVLDHLIIIKEAYFSFADEGLL
jgi:DNA repair protein RadC